MQNICMDYVKVYDEDKFSYFFLVPFDDSRMLCQFEAWWASGLRTY